MHYLSSFLVYKSVAGNRVTKFRYWLPDKTSDCLLGFSWTGTENQSLNGKLKEVIHQGYTLINTTLHAVFLSKY